MPMWISCTVKNASAVHTRRSHAAARSSAPPTQAPCTAQTIGKRAASSTSKQAIRRRSCVWNDRRLRGVLVSSIACIAPSAAKTSSAMPAEKCLPSPRMISARVVPASSSACTASRNAGKNAGAIVFMRSGRSSASSATPLAASSVT